MDHATLLSDPIAEIDEIVADIGIKAFGERLKRVDQTPLDVHHTFAPGLYIRTMRIPAGTLLLGASHKTEHTCHYEGDITVWSMHGCRRFAGSGDVVSVPGDQRLGYAHADTVWSTVHDNPDDCRDMAALEARLVVEPIPAMFGGAA